MQERSTGSDRELENFEPEKDSPEDWFKLACYLASRGDQLEAELAVKKSLNVREENPIAWAILSAILLAQGRETDAEQAGKKAISQCKDLKMTWPKMRTIIFSHAVIRGTSWKDPRRVVIDVSTSTDWGNLLSILGKASKQNIDEISSSRETLADTEESQSQAVSSKEYTPTRTIGVTEKKKYESAEKRYQSHEDRRDEQELKTESMKEYTPTRTIGVTEKKKYEPAEKRYQSHEDRQVEPEPKLESMKEYTPTRTIDGGDRKFESAARRFDDQKAVEERGTPIKQEDALGWFTAADTYLKKGNLDEAQDAFLKGLQIDPSSGDAWLRVSSIMMGKQKYDEAIVTLKHASERLPAHSGVWYQLGY
ncbi:MAG: tetratricopeptide repeat protein, partial [Candidatus Thorarchaeota archaeon]